MKEEIKVILDKLQSGEISPKKAIKHIKSMDIKHNYDKIKPAKKIKILIIDGDSNKKISLPGIPFSLIKFLGKLGLVIAPLAIRYADSEAKEALEIIKEIDFKEFVEVLKNHGKFDLVDISNEEDVVKISVI